MPMKPCTLSRGITEAREQLDREKKAHAKGHFTKEETAAYDAAMARGKARFGQGMNANSSIQLRYN